MLIEQLLSLLPGVGLEPVKGDKPELDSGFANQNQLEFSDLLEAFVSQETGQPANHAEIMLNKYLEGKQPNLSDVSSSDISNMHIVATNGNQMPVDVLQLVSKWLGHNEPISSSTETVGARELEPIDKRGLTECDELSPVDSQILPSEERVHRLFTPHELGSSSETIGRVPENGLGTEFITRPDLVPSKNRASSEHSIIIDPYRAHLSNDNDKGATEMLSSGRVSDLSAQIKMNNPLPELYQLNQVAQQSAIPLISDDDNIGDVIAVTNLLAAASEVNVDIKISMQEATPESDKLHEDVISTSDQSKNKSVRTQNVIPTVMPSNDDLPESEINAELPESESLKIKDKVRDISVQQTHRSFHANEKYDVYKSVNESVPVNQKDALVEKVNKSSDNIVVRTAVDNDFAPKFSKMRRSFDMSQLVQAGQQSSLSHSSTSSTSSIDADPNSFLHDHLTGTNKVKSTHDFIRVPVHSMQWTHALNDKIKWMVSDKMMSATLALSPEHLGPLSIKLDLVQQDTSLSFYTHHDAVRHALESAVTQIRETLSEQGLRLSEFNVSTTLAESNQREHHASSKNHDRTEESQSDNGQQPQDVLSETSSEGLVNFYA